MIALRLKRSNKLEKLKLKQRHAQKLQRRNVKEPKHGKSNRNRAPTGTDDLAPMLKVQEANAIHLKEVLEVLQKNRLLHHLNLDPVTQQRA